jgi:hypothetical protein
LIISKGSPKAVNGLGLLLGLMVIGMNMFFLTSYKFTDIRSVAQWLTHTETICERHPRSARFNVGQFAKTEDVSEARESKLDGAGLEPWWNRAYEPMG